MCLSTHEMNSPLLEREIVSLERRIKEYQQEADTTPQLVRLVQMYTGRIEAIQKLLKERADTGNYDHDFEAQARKQRQEAWDAQ